MLHHKKRKYNNFIHKPQKLKLNEREEEENKKQIFIIGMPLKLYKIVMDLIGQC